MLNKEKVVNNLIEMAVGEIECLNSSDMGIPGLGFEISARRNIHDNPMASENTYEEAEEYSTEDENEVNRENATQHSQEFHNTTAPIIEKDKKMSEDKVYKGKNDKKKLSNVKKSHNQNNESSSSHSKENNGDNILHKPEESTCNSSLIIAIVISCIIAYVVAEKVYDKKSQISPIEKKTCHMNKLEKKYPLEENILWETLKYDIEEITNNKDPEGPSVYLFLQNNDSEAPYILTDIAKLAASCFDSHSKPIILQEEDFDSNDYGIAIVKYKNQIHHGGVVVVLVHLNELPGKAARALHAICDKYSPISKKAIILLSLIIDADSKGRPIEIAENTLRDLWKSSLKNNELDPLIVRVSDSVFRLQS